MAESATKPTHKHIWQKIQQHRTKSYGLNDRIWITWACSCGATKSTDHGVIHYVGDGCD